MRNLQQITDYLKVKRSGRTNEEFKKNTQRKLLLEDIDYLVDFISILEGKHARDIEIASKKMKEIEQELHDKGIEFIKQRESNRLLAERFTKVIKGDGQILALIDQLSVTVPIRLKALLKHHRKVSTENRTKI